MTREEAREERAWRAAGRPRCDRCQDEVITLASGMCARCEREVEDDADTVDGVS